MEERLSFAAPGDQRLLEVAIAVGFTFEVQFVADLARIDIDDVYLLGRPLSDEIAVRAADAAIVAQDPRATALALDAARRQGDAQSFEVAELLARSLSAEANHREAVRICAQVLALVRPGSVPDERVWELTLQQVRSLRMVNDWSRAGQLLRELEAQLPDSADAVHAELLMLRAEFALCGPGQDTPACIELCDRVAALTTNGELHSRALGHRGLAHLAAYQIEAVVRMRLDWAVERFRDPGYEQERERLRGIEHLLRRLLDAAGPPAVIHGDLQAKNILTGPDSRWQAIDPFTCLGDLNTEAALWAVIQSDGSTIDERIDQLARCPLLDETRLRAWTFTLAVAEYRSYLEVGAQRIRAFTTDLSPTDLAGCLT